MRPASLSVLGLGPCSTAAVLWRMQGTLHVTVIVKATLALVNEGPAQLVAPAEVIVEERPLGGAAGRSLEAASDLAPHKGKTDVTFTGSAYPPGGQPAPAAAVRLAIFRDKALLDKTLRVYGERTGERPAPEAFRSMPLVFERAYGGPTFPANPVGVGADARVRLPAGAAGPDTTSQLPNIVDPADPTRPGGFGPISERWPGRARALGTLDPAALDAPILTVPSAQLFTFFQTAPPDQQIEPLRGDEWIVLDNLHPTLPRVSSRLPGIKGACRVRFPGAGATAAPRPIPMRLDTLAIDGDRQVCSVVLRGNFPVMEGEKALAALRVECGIETAGQPITWPEPAPRAPESPAAPSASPPAAAAPVSSPPAASSPAARPRPPKAFAGTAALSDEQQAWLAKQAAAPFKAEKGAEEAPSGTPAPERRPASPGLAQTAALSDDHLADLSRRKAVPFQEAPPNVPAPAVPRVPVAGGGLPFSARPNPPVSQAPSAPVPSAPVPPPSNLPVSQPPSAPVPRSGLPVSKPPSSLERTTALTPQEQRGLRQDQGGERSLPFSRGEAAPDIARPSGPPVAPRTGPLTGTAALSDEDLLALSRVDPLPFVLPAAPANEAPRHPAAPAERKVPARVAASVPFITDAPLSVATVAWQVRPPKDSITVVVKGTFDLVDSAPARLRAEPDPVLGDVHADDDPTKSLVYASDLAIFKPRCDVTLVGHAHAPRGSATGAQVGFRLGEGSKKVERTINVLGDRTWNKALGVSLAPTDPAPFDRIPVVYDRAFGGPDHPQNPAGTGHKSSAAPDGTVRLPNLEDPNKPVRSPSDSPSPQCFAPVAPAWSPRSKHLGTYDKKWLSTRWPYFPEDFDWQSAQHAPASQQTDHIAPDAPYEIRGMSPGGGTIRGRLPGLAARCFAERSTDGGEGSGGFHELPLKLDTVHFDMDAGAVVLVWRGLLEVTDEDAPELCTLFVTTEPCTGPSLTLEQARERMLDAARRAARPDGEGESPGDDLPPLPGAAADPGLRDRVIAAMAAGEALENVDLSEADLSEMDFAGRSLAGALLLRASLRGADLSGADLRGAQLGGADLTGACLSGANLDGADLQRARLERASLEGASLHGTSFARADGRGAVFRRAAGAQASFVEGSWREAVFDEVDLPAANFSGAKLDGASFVRAGLSQVRLLDAAAEKARFDGARMPNARAAGAALRGCSLRSIESPGSVWDKATLEGTSFMDAVLTGAGFSGVKARGADFGAAHANDGRFRKADLRGARFLSAGLMKATFESANLEGADLRGANLHEAETWKANLKGAQLDLAIVTRSKLARAR